MDGSNRERIVTNDLKRQVADNRKRKRQKENPAISKRLPVKAIECQNASVANDDGGNDIEISGNNKSSIKDTYVSVQLPIISRESSKSPGRLTTYREAELIMHYMDAVFPLQFRFHVPDARGRGWLLWLLVRSGPLYHAALSLSALHQSIYMPMQFQSSYTELAGYHAQALSDLRQFLQNIQEENAKDEGNKKIELLSCGVSLISFEVSIFFASLSQPLC